MRHDLRKNGSRINRTERLKESVHFRDDPDIRRAFRLEFLQVSCRHLRQIDAEENDGCRAAVLQCRGQTAQRSIAGSEVGQPLDIFRAPIRSFRCEQRGGEPELRE